MAYTNINLQGEGITLAMLLVLKASIECGNRQQNSRYTINQSIVEINLPTNKKKVEK